MKLANKDDFSYNQVFMQVFPSGLSPWIMVTGASSGIGEVFVRRFAQMQANLILVARSTDKLMKLSSDIERSFGVRTLILANDLCSESSPLSIFEEVRKKVIQLYGLVNNAGCGAGGKFVDVSRERYLNMIDLNVRALVELTHLFLPGMIERKRGFIINVSSTASFLPLPYSSVYSASKAFVTFFSEALWLETKNTGVRVLNLCPGLTKTDFGITAGMRDFHQDPIAENPQRVVETALRALNKNIPTVVSGWHNKLLVLLERFVPHRVLLWASSTVQNSRRIL